MKQPKNNIDGFQTRRKSTVGTPRRSLGVQTGAISRSTVGGVRRTTGASRLVKQVEGASGAGLRPNEASESLRHEIGVGLAQIDDQDDQSRIPKRRRHRKPVVKKRHHWIKRGIVVLLLIGVVIGGYVGWRFIVNTAKVFDGNLFGLLANKELKMDASGRTNLLIFGTSEDDPGHPGAYLTDSLMVVSINQKTHDAYMMSIPRDLWVEYGSACNAGYRGKINEIYGCYSQDGKKEEAGSKALMGKIGEVLGLDMHYYAHVNYTVVREAVDAVGGVEVVIESRDPRGILDRNFDWTCNYQCYNVKYPNGPTGILDGKHALFLARARGDVAPTYGLERSNYDREVNQQKILKALQKKAVSAGTLTNVGKVTSLMDALGKNLRTNFETAEIRTLLDIGAKTEQQNIKSLSFINDDVTLLGSGPFGAVAPVAGTYDYSQIHAYVAKHISSDKVVQEGAIIEVLNASDVGGAALREATRLRSAHFTISNVGNATLSSDEKVVIYQMGELKSPATKKRLEERYGVTVQRKNPPFAVSSGEVEFVIVLVHVTE